MEAPSEAPHKVAGKAGKNGLDALKKLPPWALILIAGVVLIAVLFMRAHSANASADTSSSTADNTANDANNGDSGDTSAADGTLGDDSGTYSDNGYDTGYESGLAAGGFDGSGTSSTDPDIGYTGLIGSGGIAGLINAINRPAANNPGTVTVQFPSAGGGVTKRNPSKHLSHPKAKHTQHKPPAVHGKGIKSAGNGTKHPPRRPAHRKTNVKKKS